ncbi:NUDIX hydrolase [Actinomadura rubrisoli]|uniref:NUDIX hydrolase n=1 Tax=Actinomadura rubrisoli TaxID=2530368 RepID=A0A4R5CFA9_9ACTN|nr:NUDIX hydrolase [Actinomadura rubrisoli]TDD97699.1 NUDIX hydrolase [Actinomadura rubrisoli]
MQPEIDTRPTIAAAVIVQGGRFLLVQRAVSEGSLSWQFPAGEVEIGETPEDAAVRETAEEAGVTVVAKSRLGERIHPATGRTMIYVACEIVEGEAHAADVDEIAAVHWCHLDEIGDFVPYGFYEPVQLHLEAQLA